MCLKSLKLLLYYFFILAFYSLFFWHSLNPFQELSSAAPLMVWAELNVSIINEPHRSKSRSLLVSQRGLIPASNCVWEWESVCVCVSVILCVCERKRRNMASVFGPKQTKMYLITQYRSNMVSWVPTPVIWNRWTQRGGLELHHREIILSCKSALPDRGKGKRGRRRQWGGFNVGAKWSEDMQALNGSFCSLSPPHIPI